MNIEENIIGDDTEWFQVIGEFDTITFKANDLKDCDLWLTKLDDCLKESKNEILKEDRELTEAKPLYFFSPKNFELEQIEEEKNKKSENNLTDSISEEKNENDINTTTSSTTTSLKDLKENKRKKMSIVNFARISFHTLTNNNSSSNLKEKRNSIEIVSPRKKNN
jgi:hypothetical protein